jgi:hypothetical protein
VRADDERGLREELERLRREHGRLTADAARLRRSRDIGALKRQTATLASIVLPLAALAAYIAYRVFFQWFD